MANFNSKLLRQNHQRSQWQLPVVCLLSLTWCLLTRLRTYFSAAWDGLWHWLHLMSCPYALDPSDSSLRFVVPQLWLLENHIYLQPLSASFIFFAGFLIILNHMYNIYNMYGMAMLYLYRYDSMPIFTYLYYLYSFKHLQKHR